MMTNFIRKNKILFGLRNIGFMAIGLVIMFPCMVIGIFVMAFNKQLGQNIGEFPWVLLISSEEI